MVCEITLCGMSIENGLRSMDIYTKGAHCQLDC